MKNQRGQALLLTMMLVATVLTVFLSISFKSTTETQVTKLEEESQKALAAAEAGIEAALKTSGEVAIGESLSGDLSGYTGSAECTTSYDKNYFVSPLIQKDEQYTFYLSSYSDFSTTYSGGINIYYGSQSSCEDISLEISLIYDKEGDGEYEITRWVADSSNMFISNTRDISGSGTTLGGTTFNCGTSLISGIGSTYPNPRFIIVHSYGSSTQIGFRGTITLLPQGKICESNATTSTVTKKVTLFQSYPQIPTEFFVTSF